MNFASILIDHWENSRLLSSKDTITLRTHSFVEKMRKYGFRRYECSVCNCSIIFKTRGLKECRKGFYQDHKLELNVGTCSEEIMDKALE